MKIDYVEFRTKLIFEKIFFNKYFYSVHIAQIVFFKLNNLKYYK